MTTAVSHHRVATAPGGIAHVTNHLTLSTAPVATLRAALLPAAQASHRVRSFRVLAAAVASPAMYSAHPMAHLRV